MVKANKFLTFLIEMPEELVWVYDFLQEKMNLWIGNPVVRKQLFQIDLSQPRGKIWEEIRNIVGQEEITQWEIPNPAWYSRMIFENIRRLLLSKQEAIVCFEELKKNGNKVDDDLLETLKKKGIFPKRTFLFNLRRSDELPTLARKATFVMDYSVSIDQTCIRINEMTFGFKVQKGEYLTYEVVLPLSLRKNLTGKITKPRFLKRKRDGKYIGHCSYEVEIEPSEGQNILGVDLGKKKLFSSVVLYSDGSYSEEIVNSRLSSTVDEKFKRKKKDLDKLLQKNRVLEKLINGDLNIFNSHLEEIRQNRIGQIIELRTNMLRTKRNQAKQIAGEIVSIAKEHHCKEIHLENLSWLESQGGRWNHSEIQDFVTEFAELKGIKVIKVCAKHTSSAHLITGELGRKSGRNVRFSSGDVIDRDLLASINIAKRNKKNQKENKVNTLRKNHTSTPKKVKKPSNRKVSLAIKNKLLEKNQRGTKIVVFYPRQTCKGTWEVLDVSSKPHMLSLSMCHLRHPMSICYMT